MRDSKEGAPITCWQTRTQGGGLGPAPRHRRGGGGVTAVASCRQLRPPFSGQVLIQNDPKIASQGYAPTIVRQSLIPDAMLARVPGASATSVTFAPQKARFALQKGDICPAADADGPSFS